MERREKVLTGLDVARLQGLEVGPQTYPLVRHEDGPVVYVDHATTAELKAKMAGHPVIDPAAMVEVDAVWGAQTLKECLNGRQVDYVVASHVIEHVPDLITWFGEIEEALIPGGQLRLVVPDKRWTFDLYRRPTNLADLVVAHLLRARRPGLQQLIDCAMNSIYAEDGWVWENRIDRSALEDNRGPEGSLWVGREFLEKDNYTDIHCWVFAPRDFARLFARATKAGLVRFRCVRAFDTEPGANEFIVHLEQCDDPQLCETSWKAMAERMAPSPRDPVEAEDGQISMDAVVLMQRRIDALARELDAIKGSRTWRATAPVRAILTRLKPRRD